MYFNDTYKNQQVSIISETTSPTESNITLRRANLFHFHFLTTCHSFIATRPRKNKAQNASKNYSSRKLQAEMISLLLSHPLMFVA